VGIVTRRHNRVDDECSSLSSCNPAAVGKDPYAPVVIPIVNDVLHDVCVTFRHGFEKISHDQVIALGDAGLSTMNFPQRSFPAWKSLGEQKSATVKRSGVAGSTVKRSGVAGSHPELF
jgi:hypothetical protein